VREKNAEILKRINSTKYDGGLSSSFPFEMMVIKTFGNIPCLKWGTYLPDPLLTLLNKQPWVGFSITLPFIHPSSTFLHYTG